MKISAQVVLINSEGLVLGVSRKNDHNDFGLPGGKMDPEDSESSMLTAYRETLEETGLKISNLRLVLAIHKDGYMSYTYLADYEGEINHNEPHVVKWLPMERLVNGSFGKYNKLVSESLTDMGIKFAYKIPLDDIEKDLKEFLSSNGLVFKQLRKDFSLDEKTRYCVYFTNSDGSEFDEDFDDEFDVDSKVFKFQKKLNIIGDKHGIIIRYPAEYLPK